MGNFGDSEAILILVGLSVIAVLWVVIHFYHTRLYNRITTIVNQDRAREEDLALREKLVVAAALEGELIANQSKLQAFLVVYQEMLRNLKEPSRAPKYKQAGDIIHEKPALSRAIFDAYIEKLSLLGEGITKDLVQIYTQVESDPAYKTLSDELSTDQAIHIVERIVENANDMNKPMEKMIGALGVIVRNQK